MDQQDPKKNPHLLDMFRTAVAGAVGASGAVPRHDAPAIHVTGNHNVISVGGTVYMQDPAEVIQAWQRGVK